MRHTLFQSVQDADPASACCGPQQVPYFSWSTSNMSNLSSQTKHRGLVVEARQTAFLALLDGFYIHLESQDAASFQHLMEDVWSCMLHILYFIAALYSDFETASIMVVPASSRLVSDAAMRRSQVLAHLLCSSAPSQMQVAAVLAIGRLLLHAPDWRAYPYFDD